MTGELEIVLKSSTQNGKFFALGYIINIVELIIISVLPRMISSSHLPRLQVIKLSSDQLRNCPTVSVDVSGPSLQTGTIIFESSAYLKRELIIIIIIITIYIALIPYMT
jgi:hypothetical protein